jgi:hypothetical protein
MRRSPRAPATPLRSVRARQRRAHTCGSSLPRGSVCRRLASAAMFTQAQRPAKSREGSQRPIEQMLRVVLPGSVPDRLSRRKKKPFQRQAPGFFAYLRDERGLRETSVHHYIFYLRAFESYLERVKVRRLRDLSPAAYERRLPAPKRRIRKIKSTGSRGAVAAGGVWMTYPLPVHSGLLRRACVAVGSEPDQIACASLSAAGQAVLRLRRTACAREPPRRSVARWRRKSERESNG